MSFKENHGDSKQPSDFPLIAVLGCTGTVGTEVMRQLATHTCAVRGILRQANRRYPIPPQDSPARVSYVSADLTSIDDLSRALVGATALFLLVGTHPEQVKSEATIIEAAQRAGVQRIVKLSAPLIAKPASVEVASWHRTIEAILASSGLEYSCLRPYAFMQNWLRSAHAIRRSGTIVGSAGSALRTYIDARDVAEVAVHLLLRQAPLPARALTLTGPEALTYQEVAERLSHVTGHGIRYENLSRSDHYQLLLTQVKLPEFLARHLTELEALAVQVPEQPTDELQAILGHYPRTVDEFLQEHRAAFA